MGSGPLDHPQLLEIEARLDRADIEAAQRLLSELGDLPVLRAATTYFTTRLLYQRGRLDDAGVIERLRGLLELEPNFPQAEAMLSAAERGSLRPDREGFRLATRPPLESAPSRPPVTWEAPARKESSAPTIEVGVDDVDTDHDQLVSELTAEFAWGGQPERPRTSSRRSLSMPEIPRAPIVPYFPSSATQMPSYVPSAHTLSLQAELELELPNAPRDTIRQPESLDPTSSGRMLAAPISIVPAAVSSRLEASSLSEPAHGPEAMLARARVLWEHGAHDRALDRIGRLECAPLLDPELRGDCARFLLEIGEPERALRQARRAQQDEPGSALLQMLLAWALVRAMRRAPSPQLFNEAAQALAPLKANSGPDPALVQALRAAVLAETGDAERAITTAHLALKLDPNSIDAEAALSLASARLGHLDDAEAAWRRLRASSPMEAEYLLERIQQLGVALRDVDARPSHNSHPAARLWDKIELELFSGEQATAVAAFERHAARELRKLESKGTTDTIALLATLAAGFFTTESVWRQFAPFDLSFGSIARVGAVLDVLYGRLPSPTLSDDSFPAHTLLAAYLGECLRQAYGGKWVGSLAHPAELFVETEHARFAPMQQLRARLARGERLLFDGTSAHSVRAHKFAIVAPRSPASPWDPAEWPSPRLMPQLGLALGQSVIELYCAEFASGPLDRSLRSLRALDDYVNLLAPPGGEFASEGEGWLKRGAVLTGAYLGETLRATIGAAWRETLAAATGPDSYVLLLPDGGVTYPVQHAFARLSGRNTTSLHDYAAGLSEELG